MRGCIVSVSLLALLSLAASCGFASTLQYEEESRRLYTFLKDYRAREHAQRRHAAVQRALNILRKAVQEPRPGASAAPSDYDTAWFLCAMVNAQKGLPPPDVEDNQELMRLLNAVAAEPQAALRTLIGVGLLWNGQTHSAAHELGQLKVELPAETERWAKSSVAAQELFRLQVEPPTEGALLSALCQAWVFSELRLPLYTTAALEKAQRIHRAGSGAEAEDTAAAMFRTAIAVGQNDWVDARSYHALVRKRAPGCSLDRLAAFTLGVQEREEQRKKRREPDTPFSLENHPVNVDELGDEWLVQRLEYHLGNANERMVLWSVARDGDLWLRALMLSLVQYAEQQPALHSMRDWLIYGGRLGELMAERPRREPPTEDVPGK